MASRRSNDDDEAADLDDGDAESGFNPYIYEEERGAISPLR